jgi:ferritin-like metal-binding protein YciE
MIEHAQDTQLKQAQSHQQETEVQADRLKKLLSELTGDDDDKKASDSSTIANGDYGHIRYFDGTNCVLKLLTVLLVS